MTTSSTSGRRQFQLIRRKDNRAESSDNGDGADGNDDGARRGPRLVAAPIPEYDVFISFRGGDRGIARAIERELRRRTGARVFLDERSVQPGSDWEDEIVESLQRSRSVIALIGPAWRLIEDRRVTDWVERELDAARQLGIGILPVLAGDPSVVRPKLGAESDWFTNQAVPISEVPTPGELRRVVTALARMGVLPTGERSVDLRQADRKIDDATAQVIELLAAPQGRDLVLVRGVIGSGRRAVLEQVATKLAQPEFSTTYLALGGLDQPTEAASRFAFVTNCFVDLAQHVLANDLGNPQITGDSVARLCLQLGEGLIKREVLPAEVLLELADDADDRRILELLRSTPPSGLRDHSDRLVSEAVRLISAALELAQHTIVFLIDDFDAIDTGSRQVLQRIFTSDKVRIIGATQPKADCSWIPQTAIVDLHSDGEALHSFIAEELAKEGIDADAAVIEAIAAQDPILRMPLAWYLIAQGVVTEAETLEEGAAASGRVRWTALEGEDLQPPIENVVSWLLAELLPLSLRPALRVGALMRQPFQFDIAYTVAASGAGAERSVDTPGGEVEELEEQWKRLLDADRDNVVLRPVPTRRSIKLAQFTHGHLVEVLVGQMNEDDVRHARALIAAELQRRAAHADAAVDQRINDWEEAADHLMELQEHRQAVIAYRSAGRMAEETSASAAAQRCYENAARALNKARLADERAELDADNLLLLANTSYRLTRIKGSFLEADDTLEAERADRRSDAIEYIRELRTYLDSGRLADDAKVSPLIPAAGAVHHYRRLSHALAGYIHYQHGRELLEPGQDALGQARHALLDAIQDAERAYGEGDSDWLLGAATTAYASVMARDAAAERALGFVARARMLQLDGFVHAERAIGVACLRSKDNPAADDTWQAGREAQTELLSAFEAPLEVRRFIASLTPLGAMPHTSFNDELWALAEFRLPIDVLTHSRAVESVGHELLNIHRHELVGDDDTAALAEAVSIAACLHDWYHEVEPAFLLALARDWQLSISAAEWANPVLLHGRLAIEMARHQLLAEQRVGSEVFTMIERIVAGHTVAPVDAANEVRLFVIADEMVDRDPDPKLLELANVAGGLDAAFQRAMECKTAAAFSRGRLIIGDVKWIPAPPEPVSPEPVSPEPVSAQPVPTA